MKTIEVSGHEIVCVEDGLYLSTKCHRCEKSVNVPIKKLTISEGITGSNKEMATWYVITQYHDECQGRDIDLHDHIIDYAIPRGIPNSETPDFLPDAASIDVTLSYNPNP